MCNYIEFLYLYSIMYCSYIYLQRKDFYMKNNTKSFFKSILYKLIFIIFYFFTWYFLSKLIHGNIFAILFYFIPFLFCFVCTLLYIATFFLRQYKNKKSNLFFEKEEISKNQCPKILKFSYLSIVIAITLIFGYKTFIFDSKFEPSILRKLSHPEKDITITLSNDNIYKEEFSTIIDDISKEVSLPDELYVSGDFKILFNHDGTITSINALLYGKNKNNFTDSFSINYNYNEEKKLSLTLNKDVNPRYDKKYSLDPLINYLSLLPLEYATSNCDATIFGISYSGEKELTSNSKGIVYIDPKGTTKESANPYTSAVTGYTISLFVPNKETIYHSLKYIPVDDLSNVDGKITTSIYRSDLSNIGKRISKTLDNDTIEFKLDDKITYKLESTNENSNTTDSDTFKLYTLYKYNTDTNETTIINNNIQSSIDSNDINLIFIDENLGFLSSSYKSNGKEVQLLRTEDGGKTFEDVTFENQIMGSLTQKYTNLYTVKISEPYEQDGILYIRLQWGVNTNKDNSYYLCKSEDNGKTWSFVKNVSYDSNDEDDNFIGIKEKSIGNINEPLAITEEYSKWLLLDIPKECKLCKLLPLCKGGCPSARLDNYKKPSCYPLLMSLEEKLKIVYEDFKKRG